MKLPAEMAIRREAGTQSLFLGPSWLADSGVARTVPMSANGKTRRNAGPRKLPESTRARGMHDRENWKRARTWPGWPLRWCWRPAWPRAAVAAAVRARSRLRRTQHGTCPAPGHAPSHTASHTPSHTSVTTAGYAARPRPRLPPITPRPSPGAHRYGHDRPAYSFQPTASDADGDRLTFSVVNKPGWATFSTGTGRLQGTPPAGSTGALLTVQISVSDGKASASMD